VLLQHLRYINLHRLKETFDQQSACVTFEVVEIIEVQMVWMMRDVDPRSVDGKRVAMVVAECSSAWASPN